MEQKFILRRVPGDDWANDQSDPPMEAVFYTIIKPRVASDRLQLLNSRFPLPNHLNHVKRIWRRLPDDETSPHGNLYLLLWPAMPHVDANGTSPREIPEVELICQALSLTTDDIKRGTVPLRSPINREEYERWRAAPYWPTVFHEPRVLLKMQATEQAFMEQVSAVVLPQLTSIDGVIIVNPRHWQDPTEWIRGGPSEARDFVTHTDPVLLAIDRVSQGQRQGEGSKRSAPMMPDESLEYLCTDHIAYCHNEPTLLGSMALLHSRIKTVVFVHRDPVRGALLSRLRLHGIPLLNHHFTVYEATSITINQLDNK